MSSNSPPVIAQSTLSDDMGWVLALVVAFVVLAGLVVIAGRHFLEPPTPRTGRSEAEPQAPGRESTLVRSWLAISLVGGLLIFVTLAFYIDAPELRSALVGGIVANAGAAVAFYFASKASDQARRDILNASLGTATVPDLRGKNIAEVNEALAKTSLRVDPDPPSPNDDAQVVEQRPDAYQPASQGSTVRVAFAGPVPPLTGLTLDDAKATLRKVGLELDPTPDQPASGDTVTNQEPEESAPVPTTRKVKATFAP
jgi:PASTA domain